MRRDTVLVVAMSLGVLVTTAGANAASPRPTIVATPDTVMVNMSVELTGSDFAPAAGLELAECGAPVWKGGDPPCNTARIPVATDAHGSFDTTISMPLCPRTPWSGGGPVTRERCYIGLPQAVGSGRTGLAGHVAIVVSYP